MIAMNNQIEKGEEEDSLVRHCSTLCSCPVFLSIQGKCFIERKSMRSLFLLVQVAEWLIGLVKGNVNRIPCKRTLLLYFLCPLITGERREEKRREEEKRKKYPSAASGLAEERVNSKIDMSRRGCWRKSN